MHHTLQPLRNVTLAQWHCMDKNRIQNNSRLVNVLLSYHDFDQFVVIFDSAPMQFIFNSAGFKANNREESSGFSSGMAP